MSMVYVKKFEGLLLRSGGCFLKRPFVSITIVVSGLWQFYTFLAGTVS